MPGVYRYTLDKISPLIEKAIKDKIPMVALFPYTEKKKKNILGTEALNEDNLVCKAIQVIKKKI
jgi:porphobilinogen synthase